MDLFSPLTLGDIELANRIVMAPLTRMRAGDGGVPGDLLVEHYTQRASTGLIITEGTYPSAESQGFLGQPGIVTDEQEAGWKRVADSVHAAGGRIVMQVMNAGRVTHPDVSGAGRTVAPSAIAIQAEVHVPTGKKPYPVPHELTIEELGAVRDEFVAGAVRAIRAGLDGVEIHGANGYLLHEFLSPVSNVRTDEFGGSPEKRARFVLEVVAAVVDAVGAGKVGIRLSPAHNIQDVLETDAADVAATYGFLADGLGELGLAYVSVLHAEPASELVQDIRSRFGGRFIINSGFGVVTTREEAIELIEQAHADAVAVGRPVMANPDLVERWKAGLAENELDPATIYASGSEGYTDYPRLSA